MKPEKIISEFRARGIQLWLEQGSVRYRAIQGTITSVDKNTLIRHRFSVVAALTVELKLKYNRLLKEFYGLESQLNGTSYHSEEFQSHFSKWSQLVTDLSKILNEVKCTPEEARRGFMLIGGAQ